MIQTRTLYCLSRLLFLILVTGFSAWHSYGQGGKTTITGTVTDSLGKVISGINIVLESSAKTGTSTDLNGKYVIDARSGDVLIFSGVGYREEKRGVGTGNVIDVTMMTAQEVMDDIVVTAFGKKQRKEAIVGSVTSVNVKDLKVPSSNLTTAFAGRIAGVIAYQRSGEPGADNASFFVRGVTTFGNGSGNPLILIDNIELSTTDLARLQPDDIESFSVLKDASATALYGARGANGVIFVTTKQGKEGAAKFNIRLENSVSQPTQRLKLADPVTYMQLYTEAQLTRDPLAQLLYTQNKIDHTIEGDNRFVYPATDWFKLMFKDRTNNQRANLSVTGGGKVAQYYVAGTYNIDNGILNVNGGNNFNNNIKLRTYQLRTNVNIHITPTTELIARMSGLFDDYKGPIEGGTNLYLKALRSSPSLFAPFYEPDSANVIAKHILFGNYRSGSSYFLNPYADMLRGYKDYSQSRMLAQFELNQDLSAVTKGLSFRGLFSTNRYAYFDVARAYGPYYYNINFYDRQKDLYTLGWLNENESGNGNAPFEDIRGVYGYRTANTNLYAQATMDYSRVFNKHNLGGTLIYVMQQSLSNVESLDVQASLPHRNLGLSGGASYAYDNRYFLQFNFGYNGSERFYKDKKFGFFPTLGAGWIVSNEKFWNRSVINRLKLRASYGMVGNDAIGSATDRFFYLSNVNLENWDRGMSFGFEPGAYSRPGVSINRYANFDISWEKSYQKNIAVELSLFNKINIVAEYYQQQRRNILMPRTSIPSTMGLSVGTQANVGEGSTQGVDISLDATHNFSSDFWLSARGSFTFATSKYVKYEEPEYNDRYLLHTGQSFAQQWGFIAERLFTDDEDVRNSPKQNFGRYEAGDIKYRDVNGDGQITSLDMVPIGYPVTPEITYGFGVSLGYKGFDLSLFLQGLARESFWIDPYATAPFINYDGGNINGGRIGQNALLEAYANSHWSEENQDIYALWPRLSVTPVNNNSQSSTWFMRDGSFLRLKTTELGYTLPSKWTQRYKISNFRIYFNGINLLTFSRFKIWDPEMGGNGLGYPVQRVMNLGVNMNF
ncbi:SusC/RagA family TonB-linked outer membrane protein [Niabella drilacis]|uniref:TonB-linked outer membrane protein, SusC/RagA family n=1 Tax=Niabella drilacis (strain DSM 25811 / CCM 8410 / CCUG 62505 / LMG 26954 / E90) TaxID=1285928 RepID=A0A1G6N4V8_NIADE|nr:TonB-dependent receptor [Niabella drilacis]SDC62888.1 TonB-linked outer membrane protein, SusC/RagA family [Niabella drilacis]